MITVTSSVCPHKRQDRVDLDAELVAAMDRVRVKGRPSVGFQRVGLSPKAPQAGICRVEFDASGHYQPDPHGLPALVVAVVEGGELVDLAAIRGEQVAARLGLGAALGLDVIDRARWEGRTLCLFASIWSWLSDPRGTYLIDWHVARSTLADLAAIRCQTIALARQVRRALQQPARLPRLEWPAQ
jgi:hypothetical protein